MTAERQSSATAHGLLSGASAITTATATDALSTISAITHQSGIPRDSREVGINLVKPAQTLTLPQKGDKVAEPSVPKTGVVEVRNIVLRLAAKALNPGQGIGW
jgi:hypothetical protein